MFPKTFDRIRLLVKKENFAWIAISLEYMIVEQGETVADAIANWVKIFEANRQLAEEHPDHGVLPNLDFDRHLFDASPAFETQTDVAGIKTLEIRGNTGEGLPPEQHLELLRLQENAGAKPNFRFFWKGFESQWHRSTFTIEGVAYPTAEHYMMASKARLFGDAETLAKILTSEHPADAKILGREIKNYRELTWLGSRHHIVFCGNYAKFTQNPDLRDKLLATGQQTLVEASPEDKIWGIGLGAEDPQAQSPRHWDGLNLLGSVLMDVREAIRREAWRV